MVSLGRREVDVGIRMMHEVEAPHGQEAMHDAVLAILPQIECEHADYDTNTWVDRQERERA